MLLLMQRACANKFTSGYCVPLQHSVAHSGEEKTSADQSTGYLSGMNMSAAVRCSVSQLDFRNKSCDEGGAVPQNPLTRKKPDDVRQATGSGIVPFYKLFSFANRMDILLILIGTIGAGVAGSPMPILASVFGDTLDSLGGSASGQHEFLHQTSQASVRCVVLGGIAAVGYFLQVSCWMSTGERQAARIRFLYLESLLGQDVSFFDTEISSGKIIENMSTDTFSIQQATGEKVGKLIQILSTLITGLVIAFARGWKLTLVVLAIIPLIGGAAGLMELTISNMSKKVQIASEEAGNLVEQVISAIKTVASYTGEKKAVQAYDKALKRGDKAHLQQALASALGLGAVLFFTFSTYALTLWYGSQLVVNGDYSGGTVAAVLFSIMLGSGALGQLSPCLSAFASGRVAADKMLRVIHRTPEIDTNNENGLIVVTMQGDIELRNIIFSYPSRPDLQIFSGFSLAIPRGITAALVGESGSGKSTVISLIERFYDPQGGEILIDGINIKKMKLSWLRKQIGLVTQEPVLIGASIKENIAYGKEGATLEEIEAAAQLANASTFIARLPETYETLVGQRGAQLSGGQKQRIAIARAILKNPCILLLDEATSALDTESEGLVQQALEKFLVNRTAVIVAHRLNTIRNADVIAVLRNGSIAEKGTHDELLGKQGGTYSQLVRLQKVAKIQEEENEIVHENQCMCIGLDRSCSHRRISSRNSSRSLSFGSLNSCVVPFDDLLETDKHFHEQRIGENTNDIEKGNKMASPNVHLWRLASLNKPEAPILILGSFAAIANGATMPIVGVLFANVFHSFYEPPSKLKQVSLFWVKMFMAIACISLAVAPMQSVCFAVAGNRLVHRIRVMTFSKVIQQEIAWFDDKENSSGKTNSRLSIDAAHVRSMVGDALALALQNLATVGVGLSIALSSCWQLALIFLALLPLLGMEGWMQLKLSNVFAIEAKAMYGEPSRIAYEALSNIRTVASFCAEDKVLTLYNRKNRASLKGGIRRAVIGGLGLALSTVILFASIACCFWVGGQLIASGKTNSKDFLRTFFSIELSAVAVSLSAALIPDVAIVKAAVNSVFSLLDRKPRLDLHNTSGMTLKRMKGEVEFQQVYFRYPTRPDVQIFHDLSFTLQARKSVAIVGESGGGKSTLIALLQRFYDPDAGRILVDRVDIRNFQIKWLRQQIGVVSQEPFLFNDTIRANIVYGKGEGGGDVVSEEEVKRVSEISNAHKFITELPDGYETVVGGGGGAQLSGGQRQRIAIARALIRDPKIMVLDEATSSLDAECEHAVEEALDRVMAGRTSIIIAHRLSTIAKPHLRHSLLLLKNGDLHSFNPLFPTPPPHSSS